MDTLRDGLHSAKLGEAHGYRSHNATQTVATQDSLSSLTQRVQPWNSIMSPRTKRISQLILTVKLVYQTDPKGLALNAQALVI